MEDERPRARADTLPSGRTAATHRRGYLAVAVAATLWAIGGVLARQLIDRGAPPLLLTQARCWVAASGMLLVVACRGPKVAPSRRPARPGLVVGFGLAIAGMGFLYYIALRSLPVAIAITIQYTAPALVVVWVAASGRKLPSHRETLSVLLVMTGIALIAGVPRLIHQSAPLRWTGIAAAVGSAVGFAAYAMIGHRLRETMPADRAVLAGFGVASIFWLAVLPVSGRLGTLRAAYVPAILFIGIASTVAPAWLFNWALLHIGPSRATITSTLQPLAAAVIARIWLGQTLTTLQLAGAAAVLAGITIVQLERSVALDTPPID